MRLFLLYEIKEERGVNGDIVMKTLRQAQGDIGDKTPSCI